jgi:hypothetical protein
MGTGASAAGGRLRDLLGTDPPESILALDDAVLSRLASVLADARDRQAADLAAAFDATLKHVPLPARGLVKRVLLG